jgi:hydroxypyruvate isomerase
MSEIVKAEGNTLATKMQYAQAMAGSSLLPRDYQNKPANLLFALEYADALGIAPIHAITSIHVINGKPSASADLIAASVRRAGHKLRVTGDDTYAEAVLIRSDDPDFEYVARWDMAKAKQANRHLEGVPCRDAPLPGDH